MGESGKKIAIEKIDLERMAEMAADDPGLISFAHTVGAAVVRPEDKGKIKGRALSAMYEQTGMDMQQIYDQMQLLAKQAKTIRQRVEISERIYQAEMNFEPLIGKVYHLYLRKDNKDMLSLIGPGEWGRSKPFKQFVASVKLLSDHTWDVLKKRASNP